MTKTMPTQPSGSPASSPTPREEGAGRGATATMRPERTIQRLVRDDRICLLTFDRPGSAANIFDRRTLTELGEELDFIAGSAQLKGVILTSAKRSIFIAGVDLNMMNEKASADDVRKLIELGQTVMNRLA